MQGGSYLGQNQWRAAQAGPPSLVTIFPMVASTSIYHDWITLNGGWRLSFNFGWGPVRQESRIMQNPGPHTIDGLRAIHYDQVQRHLPLNTMQQLVGRQARFYDDWLANPDYNAFWKRFNVEEQFDKIAVPVHTFGGWFDIFSQGTLRGYVGVSHKGATERARRMSHLVIGPWGHGPTQKFGALDFGPDANVDALTLQLRWYDYWLKGVDNGLAAEAPVKLFVMGRNEWVYEREYPLARTDYRPLYFSSGGKANTAGGDGRLTWTKPAGASPTDQFRYDPNDPVASVGGNNCCGTPTAAGPQDQRPIEGRRDILIYTSDVLQEELEATGPVKVVLYAASDAVDTDFVAKLVDVHPDGSSYNMAEGIMRARYRESLTTPRLLTPGQVNRLRNRSGGNFDRVSERPPDTGARDEQPFPAVRSQSEYGRDLRHDGHGQGGRAVRLPRRRARVSCSPARDSEPAEMKGDMDRRTFVYNAALGTLNLGLVGLPLRQPASALKNLRIDVQAPAGPLSPLGMPGLFPGRVVDVQHSQSIVDRRVSQPACTCDGGRGYEGPHRRITPEERLGQVLRLIRYRRHQGESIRGSRNHHVDSAPS